MPHCNKIKWSARRKLMLTVVFMLNPVKMLFYNPQTLVMVCGALAVWKAIF
jgi:hypothetical protein